MNILHGFNKTYHVNYCHLHCSLFQHRVYWPSSHFPLDFIYVLFTPLRTSMHICSSLLFAKLSENPEQLLYKQMLELVKKCRATIPKKHYEILQKVHILTKPFIYSISILYIVNFVVNPYNFEKQTTQIYSILKAKVQLQSTCQNQFNHIFQ